MQDKKENDDFEDLDFEDLDADDDFDESWDDFDDVDDADDDAPDTAGDAAEADDLAGSDTAAESGAPSKKGAKKAKGVKKAKGGKKKGGLFNLIIIGIAVLGGGGFVLTQLSAPPANAPNTGQNADMADAQTALQAPADIPELDGDMPPMPTPMDTSSTADNSPMADDLSLTDTPPQNAGNIPDIPGLGDASDDVLTPMPGPADESMELSDLSDLDLSTGSDFEDNALEASPEDDMADSGAGDLDLPQQATDTVEDPTAVLDIGPDIEDSQEDITMAGDLPAEDLPVMDDAPAAIPELSPQEDMVAPDEAPAAEMAVAAPTPMAAADTSALETEIDALNADMADKDEALARAADTENELSEQLGKANEKIAALEAQISKLQADLQSQKTTAATAVKPSPAVQEAVPAPVKEPARVTATPPAAPVHSVEWVLRAAQPGMATLSQKGSGDMRQVEVGDTIPGLGKIESIAVESGKWVVQGSKGRVTQ